MSIIRAGLSAHCREKQSSRRVSAARVVSSGHCTTKRAEREVLPGESEKRFAFFYKWAFTIPCGRISALSGLPMASHLPQRGRRFSAPCRGLTGLFHVNHAWLAFSCGREKERLPSPTCHGQATPQNGEASFSVLPRVCWFVSRETRTACPKP